MLPDSGKSVSDKLGTVQSYLYRFYKSNEYPLYKTYIPPTIFQLTSIIDYHEKNKFSLNLIFTIPSSIINPSPTALS